MMEDYSFLEENKSHPVCVKMYNLGKSNSERVFLYKLRRIQSDARSDEDFFQMQTADEVKKAKEIGAIYNPDGKHTWEANISWILGIVHAKRDVKLYSEIIAKNIWRKDVVPKNDKNIGDVPFSAFARELAALMKAGYQLAMQDDGFIHLTCNQSDTSQLKIPDINPTPQEVQESLKKIIFCIFSRIDENFSGISGREHYPALSSYLECCKNHYASKNEEDDSSSGEEFQSKLDAWLIDCFEQDVLKKMSFLSLIKLVSDLAEQNFIYKGRPAGPKVIEDFKNSRTLYDERLNPKSHESQNAI
jgi:hypothetical protein